jgi:transcription initiation factor TFIIIB Brf1 subunit/transcription initiation factor TFIIB
MSIIMCPECQSSNIVDYEDEFVCNDCGESFTSWEIEDGFDNVEDDIEIEEEDYD